MEPQTQFHAPDEQGENNAQLSGPDDREAAVARTEDRHDLFWVFSGEDGLRCGWSALLFVGLYYLVMPVLDAVAVTLYPPLAKGFFAPFPVFLSESIPVATILIAGFVMTRLEHRRLSDYNLTDALGVRRFLIGLVSGFAALSALVAALAAGGWIRFGHPALNSLPALKYGATWAGAFLFVGLFEEGSFRCYLLSTLRRGINFWWALAAVGALCSLLLLSSDPKGSGGVFAIALLGVIPCWLAHRARVANSSFWQAAWATSTGFAYFHTNNNGENWIGIFAAALIGFVFCVSVWVTGSAWWAIGCHAAWDWAETFFYGTPDSGFVAERHLLTTRPMGDTLWSGGADGPEGSLLVLPIILLLLAGLLLWRRRTMQTAVAQSLDSLPIEPQNPQDCDLT